MSLKRLSLKYFAASVCLLPQSLYAADSDFTWVSEQLAQFRTDTRSFMQTPPTMTGGDGRARGDQFEPDAYRRHINERRMLMRPISQRPQNDRSAPKPGDQVKDLVGNMVGFVDSLEAMANRSLTSGQVSSDVWSGDYWATFKGGIGARYGDPDFFANYDWKGNYDYILNHARDQILAQDPDQAMLLLSPAEKFDLLVGSGSRQGLSNFAWQEGKKIYDARGEIEGWFGICHGWAPAAFSMYRPNHVLELTAADGSTKIKFWPDDLKALYSFWWARDDFPTRFAGGRCESASPDTDADTGRVIEPSCYDTNAATWHLAIVNQVGVKRTSFIIDASLDRQVWNQPVKSYSFTYFNPKTDQPVQSWQEARVALGDFPRDKFKKFRASDAVAVVGIAMNLTYVAETGADVAQSDDAAQDHNATVNYLYDLEIDAGGNIVGGEWYRNAHPDFMWMPEPKARPMNNFDRQMTGSWDMTKPIPLAWRNAAQAAVKSGHIPAPIMEQINKAFGAHSF